MSGQGPILPGELVPRTGVVLLGIFHVLLALVLIYVLACIWPERVPGPPGGPEQWSGEATIYHWTFQVGMELRLILLVIVAAAVGSFVHAATSFVTFVGNRRLVRSWLWWYVLRVPIGAGLALVFYFVVRGGLLSTTVGGDKLSAYGVAGLSGMVGMFSKQATDKLREVFDTLFKTGAGSGDDMRADKAKDH